MFVRPFDTIALALGGQLIKHKRSSGVFSLKDVVLCWLILKKLALLGLDVGYWLQTDNFVEHGIWDALWLVTL